MGQARFARWSAPSKAIVLITIGMLLPLIILVMTSVNPWHALSGTGADAGGVVKVEG